MQSSDHNSSLKPDPDTSDSHSQEQIQEAVYYERKSVPHHQQSQYGNDNGNTDGLGLAQGSWPAQMQPTFPDSFSHQFNQMHIMPPGSTPANFPYHPSMSPQYTSYHSSPVLYHNFGNRQTIQPYPQYYNGASSSNMYNMNSSRQSAAFPSDFAAHSNALPMTLYNNQAPNYQGSTTRQPLRSPRQQFTDTLKRGVQNFAYQPMSSSSNVGSLKSPTTSQGSASLPARPDSAIRASQAMENENHTLPSKDSGRYTSTQSQPGPSLPSPTVPLSARFPPLPPKPRDDISEKDLREAFVKREEALMLRVEALGFQPEMAWKIFQELEGKDDTQEEVNDQDGSSREASAPILGIRLLQKLDQLQKENEDLLILFHDKMKSKAESSSQEKQDTIRLLQALDTALTASRKRAEFAEEKVTQLEKALAVACEQKSSEIIPKVKS